MDASPPRRTGSGRRPRYVLALAVVAAVLGVDVPTSDVGATSSASNEPLPSRAFCGADVAVPSEADHAQQAWGDVDGDSVPDAVTVYASGGAWHVNVISSVKNRQSDTTVHLEVEAWVAPSFEDVDHSAGAAVPPPLAIMVTGTGPNNRGILGNFTFLTLNDDYCVEQWEYHDAPFQWVALQATRHMTGLQCEGAAGSIAYVLTDSLPNRDGSWQVVNRRLTHDFTTAIITPLEPTTVPAGEFTADQYGNIFGCEHAPLPLRSDVTEASGPPAGGTTSAAAPSDDSGSGAFVAAWSGADEAALENLGTPVAISAVHAYDDIRIGPWTLVTSEGTMGRALRPTPIRRAMS